MSMKAKSVRKPFVLGNWKMNVNQEKVNEIIKFMNHAKLDDDIDVAVGVPSAYLDCVHKKLSSMVKISAQNCFKQSNGAFTGETSTQMLKDFDVKYVILGHVERRNYFGETNQLIAEKVQHALSEGFHVVVCVDDYSDENSEIKQEGVVLEEQLLSICESVPDWGRMILAYDSIQATRNNLPLSPKQVEATHLRIRRFIREHVSLQVAKNLRIIYGGCVSENNCDAFAKQHNIDGFLVGSCSLREEFLKIVASLDVKMRCR